MGTDPDSIRAEIAATRDRMAGAAEVLVERADVPANLKRAVGELRDAAVGRVDGMVVKVGDAVPGAAQDGAPPAEHRRTARRRGLLVVVGGALAIGGGGAAGVTLARRRSRRPAGPVVRAARGLPGGVQGAVMPRARAVEAWLSSAAGSARTRRDGAVSALSAEIGRSVAAEQRRNNPFWLRLVRDVVTAAATTTATLTARHLVRSALGSRSTAS